MESDWRPFERSPLGRLFKRERYVMRRKYAGKWEYRACTPEELAVVHETVNANQKSAELAKQGPVGKKPFIVK